MGFEISIKFCVAPLCNCTLTIGQLCIRRKLALLSHIKTVDAILPHGLYHLEHSRFSLYFLLSRQTGITLHAPSLEIRVPSLTCKDDDLFCLSITILLLLPTVDGRERLQEPNLAKIQEHGFLSILFLWLLHSFTHFLRALLMKILYLSIRHKALTGK